MSKHTVNSPMHSHALPKNGDINDVVRCNKCDGLFIVRPSEDMSHDREWRRFRSWIPSHKRALAKSGVR